MAKYVVKLTLAQAEALGIVVCESCGHPRNNHFDFDNKPCAHCGKSVCKGYKARFTMGEAIPPVATIHHLAKDPSNV